MTYSDPIRPLNTQEPVEEIDNLPDIDYHNIKKAAMVLRALNHKLRQQVIKTIHENKRLTVTQLYVKLRLEQSVASQHLAILRKAGIVSTERDGKFIFYTINFSRIESINEFVKNLVGIIFNRVFFLLFYSPYLLFYLCRLNFFRFFKFERAEKYID